MQNMENVLTSVVLLLLLVVASSIRQIEKEVSLSDEVLLTCGARTTTDQVWKYNERTIFHYGMNRGQKFRRKVKFIENGSLVIGDMQYEHEGNYSCSVNSTMIVWYHLKVKVPVSIYISQFERNVSGEVFVESNRGMTLTCHVTGPHDKLNFTWFHGNKRVSGFNRTLREDPYNNDTFHLSLSMTINPAKGRTVLTCRGNSYHDMYNITVIAFGPIVMTVNDERVGANITIRKRDPIVHCYLNESNGKFTWRWIEEVNSQTSTLTPKGVTSNTSSRVLQTIHIHRAMNVSCVATYSKTAGSLTLEKMVLVQYEGDTKALLMSCMGLALLLFIAATLWCTCRMASRREILSQRVNDVHMHSGWAHTSETSNNAAPLQDVDNYEVPKTFNMLGEVHLKSRLKSGGLIEYWIGTTQSSCHPTALARFMSETATVSQLLSFRALAKSLIGLKEQTNIVKILSSAVSEVHCYIYYEYVSEFNLMAFLRNDRGQSSSSHLLRYTVNVIDAMIYLNNKEFCHPALAARKVLITDRGICKIFDMWPKDLASNRVDVILQKACVPSAWLAPETLLFGQYSEKSDIWSFGVLMWEIFSHGDTPYRALTRQEIEIHVKSSKNLPEPSSSPKGVYKLMMSSWTKNESTRESFVRQRDQLCEILRSLLEKRQNNNKISGNNDSRLSCLYSEVRKKPR